MTGPYLIYSNEHGAWWRPGSMGYTRIIGAAGRYSGEEAKRICENANRYQREGEIPNEIMVLSPEAMHALAPGIGGPDTLPPKENSVG